VVVYLVVALAVLVGAVRDLLLVQPQARQIPAAVVVPELLVALAGPVS
jgi:hypothetical protein